MGRRTIGTLGAVTAAAALGLTAGTVTGNDGSSEPADRLAGSFGDPVVEVAKLAPGAGATASGKRGSKKPVIETRFGEARSIPAGGNAVVRLLCPRKRVAINVGYVTDLPGAFPGLISHTDVFGDGQPDSRSFTIALVNTSDGPITWQPEAECAKGIKYKG